MRIRQVVVTAANEVELQNLELDEKLGADEILVESEASFISAGTELAIYSAKDPGVYTKGAWCEYPFKSGYANVGIVKAAGGHAAARFKPGQRIFTYGPHASAYKYDINRMAIEVPAELDSGTAVSSRMAGVAFSAMLVSEIKGNAWVAVFGLGMVGNLSAQSYRIRGCRVIGVDPSKTRRAVAEKCGVHYTVGGTPQEAHEEIKRITGGHMADIGVDAVGHSNVVMQAVNATANYGQVVLLGTPRVPVQGDLTELLRQVHARWVTLRGALEWFLPEYPVNGGHESQLSKQQMIFDWMRRGELKLEPQISHRLPPEKIKQAYEGLLRETDTYTGVVLNWKS